MRQEPNHAPCKQDLTGPGNTTEDNLNQDDSLLDRLGRSLGAVPWWVVSSGFHAVVLTLFVLMMMEIPSDRTLARISGLPIEQVKNDEPVVIRDPVPQRQITLVMPQAPVEEPVVLPDPVAVIVPVEPIEDPSTQTSNGRENAISNLPFDRLGEVGVQGVGPGMGGGPFGTRNPNRRRGPNCISGKLEQDGVDDALAWLAKHQEPDGHWDTVKYQAQEASRCDTAATGMAALAFLGAGYTEKRGVYKDNVKRALEWIIKQQQANGGILPGANGKEASHGPGYHHAICGLALAEAYGMSRNPAIKAAAQQAINYSVNVHQDGQGSDKLGWRYRPGTAGDVSVTGWFVMQLKSARLAGLAVPDEGFRGAMAFLDSVEVKGAADDPYAGNRFKYLPASAQASPMQTMIGCTARMFLGWPKAELESAVTWSAEQKGYPDWGANGERVNWYYMYYGTMTTFQMGGATWTKWNEAMKAMLLPHQRKDGDESGSWDPTGAYANLGRVWSTANGALCLEVYYRYSPLYKDGGAKH